MDVPPEPQAMSSATLLSDVEQIVSARHPDPFRVLGMHTVSVGGELRTTVRAFLPGAEAAAVVDGEGREAAAMEAVHGDGFFEAVLPRGTAPFPYRLRVHWPGAEEAVETADPYAFAPLLGDFDLYLLGEGTHLRLWEVLGARPMETDGVPGVRFAVWAPNGAPGERGGRVQRVGRPPADGRLRGAPGLLARGGRTSSSSPTASWPRARRLRAEMGFTHVELLPVMEHPYDPSWGYQVTGYFAPTSRFGTPDDFRYLVDHLHQRGIGVILDWVPAHFPKDSLGAAPLRRDRALRARGPAPGRAPRLGHAGLQLRAQRGAQLPRRQRALLARGVPHRRAAGGRGGLDALPRLLARGGEWLPNRYGGRENLEAIEFLQQLNTVASAHPGALMIAEESTAWPGVSSPPDLGGLGFHLKWNMGWMNDFLRFIEQDPVHRSTTTTCSPSR
jgi:1,4-alpha-glucan branching enzyme